MLLVMMNNGVILGFYSTSRFPQSLGIGLATV